MKLSMQKKKTKIVQLIKNYILLLMKLLMLIKNLEN